MCVLTKDGTTEMGSEGGVWVLGVHGKLYGTIGVEREGTPAWDNEVVHVSSKTVVGVIWPM